MALSMTYEEALELADAMQKVVVHIVAAASATVAAIATADLPSRRHSAHRTGQRNGG